MFGFKSVTTKENDVWEYGCRYTKEGEFITKWSRLKKINNLSHINFLEKGRFPLYGNSAVRRGKAPSADYYKVIKEYPLLEKFKAVYPELWNLQKEFPILQGN